MQLRVAIEEKDQSSDSRVSSERDPSNEKFFEIADERRERLHQLLLNTDNYAYSAPKVSQVRYEISGQTFCCTISIQKCKPIKKEPAIWLVKTVMPGDPQQLQLYLGDWDHRSKWDKRVAAYSEEGLYIGDNGDMLTITNLLTKKYLGGAISPRQITNLVHSKRATANTIEVAACSIQHPAFASQKGFVTANSKIYGLRLTGIESSELKRKYNIPPLTVRSGDAVKWCAVECVIQSDLKGRLPKKIVEKATSGATAETFEDCRLYVLRQVMGLDVKLRK